MKYTKISANAVGEKNLKKWERPKNTDFGKYVVDDSKFIPMSESIKRAAKQPPIGNDIATMVYDFPDGKIRNENIPFHRTIDGRGIAEKAKHLTEETKKLGKAIKEANARAAEERAYQAALDKAEKEEKNS